MPSTKKPIVIINSKLSPRQVIKYFMKQDFKIKVSDSTIENSILFPSLTLAYMLLDNKENNETTIKLIEAFVNYHGRCFILLLEDGSTSSTIKLISLIQSRLFPGETNILVIKNEQEAVQYIVRMFKALSSKQVLDSVTGVTERAMRNLLNVETSESILSLVGISDIDSKMLLDEHGSISSVVKAAMQSSDERTEDDEPLQVIEDFILR